ncbi:MAG TPA: glycosyltransferase [Thermomicrobiales bacterium]|nr:glycosyltransferase [Thermomicrobiales bacterium]
MTFLVRHGVDYEHFRAALDQQTRIPAEIAHLPRPIIGYFGLMSDDWIDAELLMRIARRFSAGSLVMAGKITMDLSELSRLPNVHLLGRQPYETLPSYCKAFDVAIIPFPITPATLHANPLKAREYLAAGLPVVSTAIPEVRILPECRVAEDHDVFLRCLEAAIAEPGPRAWRSELMRDHGWEARLAEIERHLVFQR